MIIPISNIKIQVGDIVVFTELLEENYYKIFPGHEFRVLEIDRTYRRFKLKDLESDFILDNVYENNITLKVNMAKARYKYTFDREVLENLSFISRECPHTYEGYDDREIFTRCGNKELNYYNCSVRLECAKYLDKDIIKSNKILVKHLRRNKINNLNKNSNDQIKRNTEKSRE